MTDKGRPTIEPFSTDILKGYKFTKFWHEFEDQDLQDEYFLFYLKPYKLMLVIHQFNLASSSIVLWMTDGVKNTGFFVSSCLNIILLLLCIFVWTNDLSTI